MNDETVAPRQNPKTDDRLAQPAPDGRHPAGRAGGHVLPESGGTWDECFARYAIPAHLREGLERYLVDRVRPGGFLCAVLANNLHVAVGTADPESLAALPGLCQLMYNEMPTPSWGSRDDVNAWVVR